MLLICICCKSSMHCFHAKTLVRIEIHHELRTTNLISLSSVTVPSAVSRFANGHKRFFKLVHRLSRLVCLSVNFFDLLGKGFSSQFCRLLKPILVLLLLGNLIFEALQLL